MSKAATRQSFRVQANPERLFVSEGADLFANVAYYREVTRPRPKCQPAASASGRAVGAPATCLDLQARDGGKAECLEEA